MNLYNEASKLFKNKYFLYFIVFITVTNMLGYLLTNQINAVIFFCLVSILTYNFSKNMLVVLIVGLISTNLIMSINLRFREGLEINKNEIDQNKKIKIDEKVEKAMDMDPKLQLATKALKETNNLTKAKNLMTQPQNELENNSIIEPPTDPNNKDLNKIIEKGPKGVGEKLSNNKKTKTENFGPRLDYATTLDLSYKNLDQMLDTDAIKKLTSDTQKLMQQQKNLFDTMNQMVPVLEGTQNMLKGFDIKGLTNSLSQATNITK